MRVVDEKSAYLWQLEPGVVGDGVPQLFSESALLLQQEKYKGKKISEGY
jgi:hypothetical protein